MKFSLSWLRDYLSGDYTADQVADTLNRIGLEVEGVDDPAKTLNGFVVARVLTAAQHPHADRLQVLSVDMGGAEPLQVVCGAPNARAGMTGVLGTVGAVVPANGMVLEQTKIRKVDSSGMMCSSRELGLGDDHEGIIELGPDAPVGTPFAQFRGAEPVFDVAITPNRPDCMGVYGIARDLAAAGLGTLKSIDHAPLSATFPCPVPIATDDPEGCPAFYGRVIRGVSNGQSPDWMQDRLRSAGQRPISTLVDITNYLMLSYGRPAHVYDLSALSGTVRARRARAGESVIALDGKKYLLSDSMTVIADDKAVHDIGGIMGGEHSGCRDETRDVLLEIAYFSPEGIARTGRALNLVSDARQRFERGVDPAFLDTGMDILTQLILDLCGGEASEIVRAGAVPTLPGAISYDPTLAEKIGGVAVPEEEQRAIFRSLGFLATEGWQVTAPGWRPDIVGPADLVEEIVRIYGFDRIESVALPRAEGVAKPTVTPIQGRERRLRRAAATRGLNEALTWSFIPEKQAAAFAEPDQVWSLSNPISEDMKVMRPSLLPGLLAAVQRNLARGATGSRLFEIGRQYWRGKDGARDERLVLGFVLAGEKTPRSWIAGKAAAFDAFDAKAEVLTLLEQAGAPVDSLQVVANAGAQYHPGQSATLRLGPKTILASFGMIHPALARQFDLNVPVAMAELYLDAIPQGRKKQGFVRSAYSPPALQRVTRDFAFLVPDTVPAGDVVRVVRAADKHNIVAVRLFDVFTGKGVPEGQKSLALEVTLQPADKSYSDDALQAISAKVTGAVQKLGGTLRT